MTHKSITGLFLLMLLILIFPVSASVDGTEVWDEEGYIKYDVSYTAGSITLSGGAEVTYIGVSGDTMEYEVYFSEELGILAGTSTVTVDKSTGLLSDGTWPGYFADTSDYEEGRFVDNIPYVADSEAQYEITGSSEFTVSIQDDDTDIDIWELSYDDGSTKVDLKISQNGGVMLKQVQTDALGSLTVEANYIDGVNVKSSFFGFLGYETLTLSFILSTTFVVMIRVRKLRN